MTSFFRSIFSGIGFLWTHWSLIWSFRTFPSLPKDWTDSEQVRLFFIALMRSCAAVQLTQLTPTKWDDNLRRFLASLAENVELWNIAWDMFNRVDIQGSEQERRPTLRERIRERMRGIAGAPYVIEVQVEGVCELVSAIGVLDGIFVKAQLS